MICVGVDAGGSATVAAMSVDGAFVREGAAGPANATTSGTAAASSAIVEAVRAALDGTDPDVLYVGAAGAGRSAIADTLRALLHATFARTRVIVKDDTAIALRAELPDGDGAVLVAGTGSVAYAERGDASLLIGGLGYLAGDEGSAFWIGWQAVKLLGRVLDGRSARDETTDLVARALHAESRDGFADAVYDVPLVPARIAALAPSIIAFAGKGNRASTKIVQAAAVELAELVKATLRGLALLDASPCVVLSGGLFRENSLLTFLVETRLQGDVAGVQLRKGGDAPARAALRCAERAAHAVR